MNELIAIKLLEFYLTNGREPSDEELFQIAIDITNELRKTKSKYSQTRKEL